MLLPVLFVLIMAQPNLATGMMPLYRADWNLGPLLITVIFATYLCALVPTLATIGRPTAHAGWWWRVLVGAAAALAADGVMATAHAPWMACSARVLAGISVGLVAGSISGIMLQRIGERSRTVMATGTVLGSAVGTLGAAGCAQYLPGPRVTVYLLHATLVLVTLALCYRDHRIPKHRYRDGQLCDSAGSIDAEPASGSKNAVVRPAIALTSSVTTGYLCGISAWVSAGLVAALLPSFGAEILHTANLAVLAAPVAAYLLVAWVSQRIVPSVAPWVTPVRAQCIIIVGIAVIALVPVSASAVLLTCGGAIAGAGQGLTYRCGLTIVSAGSGAARHAGVVSRYAAVAYLAAAVATVGFGAIASLLSIATAIVCAAVVLGALAVGTRGQRGHQATSLPGDVLV